METSLSLFLLSAVGISLTGVMLPGPMTAATIAKGYSDKHAGAWIAAGHAVIEIPLIAAIYLGFGHLINLPYVVKVIRIIGGLMLVYLGFRMFRTAGNVPSQVGGLPSSSLVTGIVLTGANPGFYMWWVFVGTNLIVGNVSVGNITIGAAATFGLIGVVSFALAHWCCDLVWSEFLSVGTFESRRWWTSKVQRIVFSVCALILAGFGVWFCLSAFL
ncbi:MAG: LysE family transporter [Dehalococcoidia bacterium]